MELESVSYGVVDKNVWSWSLRGMGLESSNYGVAVIRLQSQKIMKLEFKSYEVKVQGLWW